MVPACDFLTSSGPLVLIPSRRLEKKLQMTTRVCPLPGLVPPRCGGSELLIRDGNIPSVASPPSYHHTYIQAIAIAMPSVPATFLRGRRWRGEHLVLLQRIKAAGRPANQPSRRQRHKCPRERERGREEEEGILRRSEPSRWSKRRVGPLARSLVPLPLPLLLHCIIARATEEFVSLSEYAPSVRGGVPSLALTNATPRQRSMGFVEGRTDGRTDAKKRVIRACWASRPTKLLQGGRAVAL